MKKRIRFEGETLIVYNLLMIGVSFFIIIAVIMGKGKFPTGTLIIIFSLIILVWVLGIALEQKYHSFIEIFNDKLVLHHDFRKRKIECYKENIVIRYVIHQNIYGRTNTCPCFVIGIWMGSTFRYTKNKFIYDNYFLLLLDSKKLNIILSWYDDEIQLPEEEEINALRGKKVKKFYEIIKLHNERISKQQKAK